MSLINFLYERVSPGLVAATPDAKATGERSWRCSSDGDRAETLIHLLWESLSEAVSKKSDSRYHFSFLNTYKNRSAHQFYSANRAFICKSAGWCARVVRYLWVCGSDDSRFLWTRSSGDDWELFCTSEMNERRLRRPGAGERRRRRAGDFSSAADVERPDLHTARYTLAS